MHKNSWSYLSSRIPMDLELGAEYSVYSRYGNKVCRFIKVTPCGYNFLNLESSKCILKRHLYPYKKTGKFYVPRFLFLSLKKIKKNEEVNSNALN